MAISSESTIIIDVELTANEARQQAEDLGGSIERLRQRNADLARENRRTSASYVENQQNIRRLSAEQRQYIQIANSATGSNNQLRAQLSLLTAQYNALSREERENTTAGQALTLQINQIRNEVSKNEQAIGDYRRSVGQYTDGINKSIVAQLPFINQLTVIKDAFSALKISVDAQKAATELNTIAQEATNASLVKQEELTVANTAATEANTAAERQAVVAQQLRAEADAQRIALEAELLTEQEAQAAILAQLAAEEAALLAEEQLRVTTETALVATQVELVAAEEARAASETALAASTASVAAAEEAVAAKAAVMKTALLSTGIAGVILLVGSLVTYLHDLDTAADSTSQVVSGLKAQFNELGRSIFSLDFKNLTQRIKNAGFVAAAITEQQQSLEDSLLNQSIKSQQAQAKVAQLRVEAMNRTLSPEVRQRYIDQAEAIDKIDLEAKKKLADRELNQAEISINLTGNLTKFQQQQLKQRGVEYALYLQNNLTDQGKVTDEQTKQLAKAYANQTQIQQEFTQRSEKRQNLADRIADQAEQKRESLAAKEKAAAEKLQSELDKINEDRIKSQLVTTERLFTDREREIGAINADIDKRVKLWQKYGQDTTQLENERQTRINALNTKFHQQDLNTIRQNLNEAQQLRLGLITDNAERAFEIQQLQNQNQIAQVDKNIGALVSRVALGEQGLTDVINSEVEKRNALVATGDFQRQAYAEQLQTRLQEIERNGQESLYQQELAEYQRQYDLIQQRLQLNEQLTQSYSDLVGAIGGLTDKQTTLGKIAFLAQKAFAIQQIILNAELTKSQIILRYEILKTQATLAASLSGPFAPFVAAAATAALNAAQAVELGKATAQELVQVGIVTATALGGVLGKEKGGIQYASDGKGTILPGYSKHDNMNARLRDGEAVIVSEAAKDPYTRQVLSDINVAYGGKAFANGGVYGGSYIQSTSSSIANQVYQTNMINDYISKLKIYTAVTDINAGQAKYAQITEAGNF